jgi:hypothetical protein
MTLPTPQPVPILPEWLTPLLAIWGAFLSSVALGWNLYRDLRDRSKLQISVRVRRIVQSTDGKWYAVNHDLPVADASEQLFVIMSAVNTGRRPVVWEGWGGNYHNPVNGKTAFAIIPQNLPRRLEEGETHSELTKLEDDLRPAAKNVKRLFLWDTTGKRWKLSWWKLRALRKEALAATVKE